METYEELFQEWIPSASLQKHCRSVAASMRGYARLYEEDEELWYQTGLLHDLDFEKYPEQHPFVGAKTLQELGYPEELVQAVLGHADYSGVPRVTFLARMLSAVDELSSFIVAVALMRPTGFEGLELRSVKKKLKDKAFAAAVSREDIRRGAEEIGLPLDEHISHTIRFLQEYEMMLNEQGKTLLHSKEE